MTAAAPEENILIRVLAGVGRVFLNFLATVGKLSVFTGLALRHCVNQ